MTEFDDNFPPNESSGERPETSQSGLEPSSALEPRDSTSVEPEPSAYQQTAALTEQALLPGDPISLAATAPHSSSTPAAKPQLPEDLRISWSWLHFVIFTLFGGISLIVVQTAFVLYYVPLKSVSNQKELERIALSKPMLAVGSMVVWYGLVLLFLYVTLSVFHGAPFWRTLGWRKIPRLQTTWPKNPWLYLGSGCMLSILVFAATAKMKAPEDVPIQELFRYKNTAMLFMAMAVLVAPLVEETIFRGYLYPLFAKSFGVAASILITGTLFGLMHGAQLGWTWGLVSVLIVVGVVFTFVRARTGTVFASFLLHLGYNSTIAAATILGTWGFTKIPPTH